MVKQQVRAQIHTLRKKIDAQIRQLENNVNERRTRNERTKDNAKRVTEAALNLFTAACLLFTCFYKEWKKTRQRNIKSLVSIAGVMEKKKNDTNISEVAGASAGLAGGILTIAGLITMPLTREYKIQTSVCTRIFAADIFYMMKLSQNWSLKKIFSRLLFWHAWLISRGAIMQHFGTPQIRFLGDRLLCQ